MNEERWRERIDELLTSIDNQGYKSKALLERVDKIQTTLDTQKSHLASIRSSLALLVFVLVYLPLILGGVWVLLAMAGKGAL